jgi:hypothetical protein
VVLGRADEDHGLGGTVGFVADAHPLVLDLPAATAPQAVLEAASQLLSSVPCRGVGFGASGAEVRTPEIRFNFVGVLDGVHLEHFAVDPALCGASRSPRRQLEAELDLSVSAFGGQVTLWLEYCGLRIPPAAARGLLSGLAETLSSLA